MTEPVREQSGRITRGELRDFFEDYAACLDAEALREFPAFFTEDAKYQVISRENHDDGLEHASIFCLGRAMIEDRVTDTVEAALYQPRSLRHLISGVRIVGKDVGDVRHEPNFILIAAPVVGLDRDASPCGKDDIDK